MSTYRRDRFGRRYPYLMFCCCFILIVTVILVLLFFVTRGSLECSKNADCPEANPCTSYSCQNNKCIKKLKPKCCYEDSQCDQSNCYQEFCNPQTLTCQLKNPVNGTPCDDFDPCTENDVCTNYKCSGTPKICESNNPCTIGTCTSGGCTYEAVQNGNMCHSNDMCILESTCQNGLCIVNEQKDCSHLDKDCSFGKCNNGECISLPRRERQSCDDGFECTLHDMCLNGVCKGQENPCYDNNPCTFNKCVEGFGCMLKYNLSDGNNCNATCTDNFDCPKTGDNWACVDGTCVTMATVESYVRFIDYEIENCTLGGHRLVMDFILDTAKDENQIVIPKSLNDIVSSTDILGFIDQKYALDYIVMENYTRTGFTLTTACQDVSLTNCDQIFSNRKYSFYMELYSCETLESECVDQNIMISSSIALSISDCSNFGTTQHIPIYGEAVMYVHGYKYTGVVEEPVITTGTSSFVVGYVSPVLNNADFKTMTTNFRICRGDPDHYLYKCVAGTDPDCTITGCYNWDPNDSPILIYHDIVIDHVVTAIAKTNWIENSCYPEDKYNAPDKCSLQKCTTDNWVAEMDDGFYLKTKELQSSETHLWTFDIMFKVHLCHHLGDANTMYHNIGSLVI